MKTKRLEQALVNLKTLEQNCTESKKGFEPGIVVCMYLVETLLVTVDIYPCKVLRKLGVTTSFNDRDELIEFLDTIIGKLKRVEHFALTNEESLHREDVVDSTAYDFIINGSYEPNGQLETFLKDLLNRLNQVHEMMSDPRRSQAKVSYLTRMLNVPLIQIASILEALSVGIANV